MPLCLLLFKSASCPLYPTETVLPKIPKMISLSVCKVSVLVSFFLIWSVFDSVAQLPSWLKPLCFCPQIMFFLASLSSQSNFSQGETPPPLSDRICSWSCAVCLLHSMQMRLHYTFLAPELSPSVQFCVWNSLSPLQNLYAMVVSLPDCCNFLLVSLLLAHLHFLAFIKQCVAEVIHHTDHVSLSFFLLFSFLCWDSAQAFLGSCIQSLPWPPLLSFLIFR